jgi:hypothetical protein
MPPASRAIFASAPFYRPPALFLQGVAADAARIAAVPRRPPFAPAGARCGRSADGAKHAARPSIKPTNKGVFRFFLRRRRYGRKFPLTCGEARGWLSLMDTQHEKEF